MVPNVEFHISTIHFEPPKRGQPPYKGHDVRSKGVLYNYGGLDHCIIIIPVKNNYYIIQDSTHAMCNILLK